MSAAAPAQEALEVLARVREALPRLREAADPGDRQNNLQTT